MKKIIFIICCLALTIQGIAQQKEAKMLQFNNFSSNFEVPQGTTWMIQSIFSNSVGKIETNADGSVTSLPVRIFIKTFNGDIKTDYEGNRFGPQVFQSNNTASTIAYPITLPEGTKFSLVLVVGDPGSCTAFNGSGFISLFEVKNNDF